MGLASIMWVGPKSSNKCSYEAHGGGGGHVKTEAVYRDRSGAAASPGMLTAPRSWKR